MTEQKQLYGIAIFEESILLSDFTGEAEKRYNVDPPDLMAFFRTEQTFRPFPGLVWMKTGSNGDEYMITLPAGERTILYHRHAKNGKGKIIDLKLRLPSMAVRVKTDDRKISSINMWGYQRTLTDETTLYELPLPNLTGSSLCLGSTEGIVANNIRGAVERTIFDTPFNHHSHLVGKGKIPFLKYVKTYQGKAPFATLVKIGTGADILEAR